MISTSSYRIKKKLFNGIFYWLTNWLTDWLPYIWTTWCLQTSITQCYGLIFFTIWRRFGLRGVFLPFAVATVHPSWTYLYVLFPFFTTAVVLICGRTWMAFNCVTEIVHNFHTALQHSFCGLVAWTIYPLYVTMVNGKNMAVIEAKR